jgi:hypothetical protein
MEMRRLLLGLGALFLIAPLAFASVNGVPDSATVSGLTGSHAPLTNATTGASSMLVTGANFNDAGFVTYSFTNAVSAYGSDASNQPHNLAIVLGDATGPNPAVASGGALQIVAVDYSLNNQSTWVPLTPLSIAQNLNATSSAVPATRFEYWFGGAPDSVADGLVTDVRIEFRNLSFTGATTFYLAYIQNPEPGTFALFGVGLAGAGWLAIRRRRRARKTS